MSANPMQNIQSGLDAFNTKLASLYSGFLSLLNSVKADGLIALNVAKEDLPKLQEVLAVASAVTALIPGGPSGYLETAAMAVGVVDGYVKTADGVLMSATQAAAINAPSPVPATPEEKRTSAVKILAQAYPTVPTATHDMHVAIAFTKVAKIQAAPIATKKA